MLVAIVVVVVIVAAGTGDAGGDRGSWCWR